MRMMRIVPTEKGPPPSLLPDPVFLSGKFFLKYPPAALNSLLEAWQQYVATASAMKQSANPLRMRQLVMANCTQLTDICRRQPSSTMRHGHQALRMVPVKNLLTH